MPSIIGINVPTLTFPYNAPLGYTISPITITVTGGGGFHGSVVSVGTHGFSLTAVQDTAGKWWLKTNTTNFTVGQILDIVLSASQRGAKNILAIPFEITALSVSPPPPLTVSLTYQYVLYTDPITNVSYAVGTYPQNMLPGTVIAKLSATRSDGQPFTGHMDFMTVGGVVQNYNGAYSLTNNADHTATLLLSDPNKLGTVFPSTDHVKIQAFL